MNRRPPGPCRNSELSECADMSFPRWTARDCFTPEDDLNMFASYCILRLAPLFPWFLWGLECFWKCQISLKSAYPDGEPVRTTIVGDTLAVGCSSIKACQGLRSKIYVANIVEQLSFGTVWLSQMITGVLFPNSSIYSITLRKDGNVTCWTFLSVLVFLSVYSLQMLDIFMCLWSYQNFLLLAVHCQYCLCLKRVMIQ